MFTFLVVMYGGAFAGTKLTVQSIPPLVTVAARASLAAAFLYAVLRFSGETLPPVRQKTENGARFNPIWAHFIRLGFFGVVLPFGTMSVGVQYIDSALAGILTAIVPIATLVMAHFFSPGERISVEGVTGFALSFIGLCILMGPSALSEVGGNTFVYQLMVLVGAVSYAGNTVLIRRGPPTPFLTLTTGAFVGASLFMVPLALALHPPGSYSPSVGSVVALVALAFGPTALAGLTVFRLIQLAGASFAAASNYFVPVVAIIVGAIAYGERMPKSTLVALAVILGGVAISQMRFKELGARLSGGR
ncbi:MAG: DMT family transporter [Pseudomonadota bacterium]